MLGHLSRNRLLQIHLPNGHNAWRVYPLRRCFTATDTSPLLKSAHLHLFFSLCKKSIALQNFVFRDNNMSCPLISHNKYFHQSGSNTYTKVDVLLSITNFQMPKLYVSYDSEIMNSLHLLNKTRKSTILCADISNVKYVLRTIAVHAVHVQQLFLLY